MYAEKRILLYTMVKNTSTIPFIMLCLTHLYIYPSIIVANNTILSDSVITLPVEADLQVLEDHLNTIVPQLLTEINEPDKVCLEAKYFKTKGIPKCRRDGYKISCKENWIKIKTLPKINCTIKGWVKRDGPISLFGEGKTLTFSFPLKAQVSTEAGIRETAYASAVLFIHATPVINNDWSVSVNVTHNIAWSKQPTVKILNIVDYNIKKNVEPKLRHKMDQFVKKLPALLAKFKIKEKIHSAWNTIQEPVKIDNRSNTYLIFRPESASYSGFTIADNILKMTIRAKGATKIMVGDPTLQCKKTSLCKLKNISHKKGEFNFNIPVSVSYKELLALSSHTFSETYTLDMHQSTIPGILKITNTKIQKSQNGHINITAHISYDNRSPWLKTIDIFNWFDVDGEISFKGLPQIEKKSRSLVLHELEYDANTNNDLFDIVVDAAELDAIKSHFSDLIKYEFGSKIDDNIMKANLALKQLSKGNINISAFLEVASIEDIIIHEEHITINTKLSGTVKADVRL